MKIYYSPDLRDVPYNDCTLILFVGGRLLENYIFIDFQHELCGR